MIFIRQQRSLKPMLDCKQPNIASGATPIGNTGRVPDDKMMNNSSRNQFLIEELTLSSAEAHCLLELTSSSTEAHCLLELTFSTSTFFQVENLLLELYQK